MAMVDYVRFRKDYLRHSAKGTTWDEHKYILRKNGTYYYPDSYEGGRHLPDKESLSSGKESESAAANQKRETSDGSLSSTDVENLAWEVIRGNFGSGSQRRELLGEYYQQIQDRVNEIWRETGGTWRIGGGSTPTAEQKAVEAAGEKAVEQIVAKVDSKGLDMSAIYSVYDKHKKEESKKKTVDREPKRGEGLKGDERVKRAT